MGLNIFTLIIKYFLSNILKKSNAFFIFGPKPYCQLSYCIIIYFRLPFISLVRSSVDLLKAGLEALVERSALGYPRLIHLITDILFRQV